MHNDCVVHQFVSAEVGEASLNNRLVFLRCADIAIAGCKLGEVRAIENEGKMSVALEYQNAFGRRTERLNDRTVRPDVDSRNGQSRSDQITRGLGNGGFDRADT